MASSATEVLASTTPLVFDNNMMASAIILVVTFVAIFTEELHHIHRTKCAMVGAAVMVITGQVMGFYDPEGALQAIDWNVVLLLGAMMTIVSIMVPTGGFQAIAYSIARFSKGRQFLLLALMCSVVAFISTLLDNVTTIIIFGPLIVIICQTLRVNPIPFLLSAAFLSNVGGVATLVGDPPNLMIGSAANIDFNTFVLRMGLIVLAACIGALFAFRFIFRKPLATKAKEVEFSTGTQITDRYTWISSLVVLALMVVLFIFHSALHWEAWVVAAFGLTILMALTHTAHPDERLAEVELALLLFFVSLFVVVGGVEHSHFLMWIGQFIKPFVESDLLMACIILMWAAAILSAAIDNIPFAAAMIPIILGMEAQGLEITPLWWALAIGAGMGGNGSHLGSTANVFIVTLSERLAKKEADPSLRITPLMWFQKGLPVMLLTLVICTVGFVVFFEHFAKPL